MLEARLGPGGGAPRSLRLGERGRLLRVEGRSAVAGLPASIAERQARRARERLTALGVPVRVATEALEAPSPGTFLFLEARFENSRCCAMGLGERGKPAERVADEAVDEVEAYVRSGAAVDGHLADQILLPLALAEGESSFTAARVTRHLTTNAEVIGLFLPGVRLAVEGVEGSTGRVTVRGCPR
jgi:RNA 3'-terminal phosphate cyclase (ATP)